MMGRKDGPCRILVAGSDDDFLSRLKATLARLGCELHMVRSLSEVDGVLSRVASIAVVVSQLEFPDGDWRALVDRCKKTKPNPNVILLADEAKDAEIWKELLMLGGYDICDDVNRLQRIAPEAYRRWHRCQETETARKQNLETIKSRYAD